MSASLNLLNPTAISAGTGTRIGYSTERASSGRDLFRAQSSGHDFDRALQQQVQRREERTQPHSTEPPQPDRSSASAPEASAEPARSTAAEKPRTTGERPEARTPSSPSAEKVADKASAPTSTDTPSPGANTSHEQASTAAAEVTTSRLLSEPPPAVATVVDPLSNTLDRHDPARTETTAVQGSLPDQIAALLAQATIKAEPATANLAALPAALAALSAHRANLPAPLHGSASTPTDADAAVTDDLAGNTLAANTLTPGHLPTTNAAANTLPTANAASLPSDATSLEASGAESPTRPGTPTTDDSPAKSLQNRALLLGDARTAVNDTTRSSATDAGAKLAEQLTPAIGKAAIESVGADTQGMQSGGNGQSGQSTLQPGHTAFHALVRSAASNAPNVPQLPVHTPAGQPAWAEDVGNQVHWMLGRAENKAELVLTPPNMGKLEVSISLNGDQTTAQFIAASQAARDALEQAMPRLREILQQAGISLGDTQVSTSGEQRAQDGQQDGSKQRGERLPGGLNEVVTASTPVAAIKRHDGMVDTFV